MSKRRKVVKRKDKKRVKRERRKIKRKKKQQKAKEIFLRELVCPRFKVRSKGVNKAKKLRLILRYESDMATQKICLNFNRIVFKIRIDEWVELFFPKDLFTMENIKYKKYLLGELYFALSCLSLPQRISIVEKYYPKTLKRLPNRNSDAINEVLLKKCFYGVLTKFDKRRREKKQIEKMEQGWQSNVNVELCGIRIPPELLPIVISYLPKGTQYMNGFALVNSTFYIIALHFYDHLTVQVDNPHKIPKLAIQNAKTVRVLNLCTESNKSQRAFVFNEIHKTVVFLEFHGHFNERFINHVMKLDIVFARCRKISLSIRVPHIQFIKFTQALTSKCFPRVETIKYERDFDICRLIPNWRNEKFRIPMKEDRIVVKNLEVRSIVVGRIWLSSELIHMKNLTELTVHSSIIDCLGGCENLEKLTILEHGIPLRKSRKTTVFHGRCYTETHNHLATIKKLKNLREVTYTKNVSTYTAGWQYAILDVVNDHMVPGKEDKLIVNVVLESEGMLRPIKKLLEDMIKDFDWRKIIREDDGVKINTIWVRWWWNKTKKFDIVWYGSRKLTSAIYEAGQICAFSHKWYQ